MRIYTKTGDDGTTALLGGRRVPKDHPRVQAYGEVDELNALLGLALVHLVSHDRLQEMLRHLQRTLFIVGAELATPPDRQPPVEPVTESHVHQLEKWIDEMEQNLPTLRHFILPGGSAGAATLHVARTVCRRAERRVVTLFRSEPGNANIITYLNRLGDLLFVMARAVNAAEGVEDIIWDG